MPVNFRQELRDYRSALMRCPLLVYACVLRKAIVLDRWELSSLTSQKTCIFKPNALGDGAEVKKATFGGLFANNFQKVPRNPVASVMWEVPRSMNVLTAG